MMNNESKLMDLRDAVSRFVNDGCSIVMGTSLESLIPFAFGHELIRQGKRELTLIGPISDILFDQVIGGGCVSEVRAAWVGNVITGSGYNFRRAVESGDLKIEDHSNLTIALALRAGAMGVPYMPSRTALGSDLFKTNSNLKTIECPFTGETLSAVAAINPDVAVVHAQRADEHGRAHVWGNLGTTREACLASRNIIVTAEEIVAPDVISSDPNRIVAPAFKVCAVARSPWGGYPSPVPGCYNRDHQAFIDYRNQSKTSGEFQRWRTKWIDNTASREEYMELLGGNRMSELSLKHHLKSEPADYGY